MIAAGYEKGMRMKRHKIRKKRNPGWYFLLPEFLGVSVFGLIPFADVVRRSFFQTVDGSFVGISNYMQVIKNDAFNLAAKNTLRFVVTCIPCLLLLSLILAMLLQQVLILAEKKKKHRDVTMEQFYRGSAAALKSMYLLPMAILTAHGSHCSQIRGCQKESSTVRPHLPPGLPSEADTYF